MNATVNVVCYKWKTLSNGKHPLMLRVCKDGNRRYVSLKVSVKSEHWDFEKSKPKRNCPNREGLEKLISEHIHKYSHEIIGLTVEGKDYTTNSLIEKVTDVKASKTLDVLFQDYICSLMQEGRVGYALSVKQVYNSLLEYRGHLDFYLAEVDVAWLKSYEVWLRSKGLADNTIGIRFRTLRVVYNFALMNGLVKPELYPFKKYKVSKLHQDTAKRAISKEQVMLIVNYDTSHSCLYKRLAVDMFVFSYLMGGINFVDMCMLTKDNIEDGRLIYVRKKTKKLIKLPLQERAIQIIDTCSDCKREYLFPVLGDKARTVIQTKDRIYDVLSNINRHLKKIGEEYGFELKITTYVARHTQATVMKRAGVSTSVISELMGHSSERVTQYYLDSFGNEQMDDAMKSLL